MDQEIQELCDYLVEKLETNPTHRRLLVGLAGVPGSGKSTIAELLNQKINDRLRKSVPIRTESNGSRVESILVGLDGWHLSRAELDLFPDPKLAHDRRGVHWTFNGSTYVDFVRSLHEDVTHDIVLKAPSFIHSLKDPTPDAIVIHPYHRIVILEGLYVFLSIEPWNKAGILLDERWLISVDQASVKTRLVERHVRTGVASDANEAAWRADENDIPNGQFLLANNLEPTRVIHSMDSSALNSQ
ncbi:P-loop containing nucleoside triphosphate hydrolase protein [Crepidotus variabilis]|uniref:P-loop containing nucleoside triphosphate hydrolase protein n=1 Tax=Crepidotus variabilis TaxID=179855 RepID=A0A9P6JNY7_9AGAR|nr:P-loop containing nucleoside triphosphate hydrolase protein [Crepidotus variabilis]